MVAVLGGAHGGKAFLLVGVTPDLTERVHAGNLIKEIVKEVGGNGGGRPDMAQAGGNRPEGLDAALKLARKASRSETGATDGGSGLTKKSPAGDPCRGFLRLGLRFRTLVSADAFQVDDLHAVVGVGTFGGGAFGEGPPRDPSTLWVRSHWRRKSFQLSG